MAEHYAIKRVLDFVGSIGGECWPRDDDLPRARAQLDALLAENARLHQGTGIVMSLEEMNLETHRENARLRDALTQVRARINVHGMDVGECDDPGACPWREQHKLVAIIDKALLAPEGASKT